MQHLISLCETEKTLYLIIAPESVAHRECKLARDIKDFSAVL